MNFDLEFKTVDEGLNHIDFCWQNIIETSRTVRKKELRETNTNRVALETYFILKFLVLPF
jgi:hypothetical protein